MHRCFSIELVGTDAPHSPEEPFAAHSGSFLVPTETSENQNELTFFNKLTEEGKEPPSSAFGVTPENTIRELQHILKETGGAKFGDDLIQIDVEETNRGMKYECWPELYCNQTKI